MAIELVAIAALLGAAAMVSFFVRLENEGRSHVVVQILLVALLYELVVHASFQRVPVGVFRVPLGPFDARPADLLVPLALAARAFGAVVPRQIRIAALLWGCFSVWYLAQAPVGILNGNESSDVIAQGRGIMIGAGLMVLVSGIDITKLVAGERLQKAGRIVGVVGAVLFLTHFAKLSFRFDAPIIGFDELGALGGDSRTLFPILGLMALMAEISSGKRRMTVIVPSFALLVTPVAATQGGPYLSLLLMMTLLTIVAAGSTWKRRMNLTAVDVGFVLSLFLIIGAVSVFSSGGAKPVFVDQFEEAVLSDSQATTTGERYQLWDEAGDIIAASPIWGDGLGVFGTIERRFPNNAIDTTFHNVPLDIAARTGLVGAALASAAMAATAFQALKVWRRHANPVVASVAMTAMLGSCAIMARAFVSSSIEHPRVTVAYFLLIGLVLACARSLDEATESEQEQPELVAVNA